MVPAFDPVLSPVENFSLDEIAEITGVPVGTVKSRLHHARTAFRKLWTLNQTAS